VRRVGLIAGVIVVVAAAVTVWWVSRQSSPSEYYQPRAPGSLTFNEDIAPVFHRECSVCHRPGESAPFALLTYDDVRSHAKQIVDVTMSGFMPPWLPEPGPVSFVGERHLSFDEIGMIRQWVEEGAARGEGVDEPTPPRFADGWQLGEPDVILEMPEPYTLAAGGEDVFRNFVYRTGLTETRHVRALEFRAATPRAVHHATITVDRTAKSRYHDQREPGPGFDGMLNSSAESPDGHLVGWVPGKMPHELPSEIAWRLDPGTDLIVQLHLLPSGKPESIHPEIGLYFSDEVPSRRAYMLRLGSRTIDVAAGQSDYAIEDTFVLPVDVEVYALLPHAHYLAKEMQGHAVLPNGTKLVLIHIRDWDFNWQDEYRLAEPLLLPRGTMLSMRFTYDNTAGNVRNPHDPPRRVVFGPKTEDEMGDLWIQVVPRNSADLGILEREFLSKERQANRDCYEKMLADDPDDVTVRYELGEMLQQQGNLTEAIPHFERVLELDPDHVPANAALGRARHAEGRTDLAIEHFQRALRQMPELAELHFNLGQSYRVEGRFEQAIDEYRTALELEPGLAAVHFSLGEIYRAQGNQDAAAESYAAAIEADPGYAQAYNNLGSIAGSRGDIETATELFRRAVEIDPGYAQAHNNLGMALASRGRLDEAIFHFTRAVELRPDHQASQRNLANALRTKARN
jgi:tetratricopeptide (TPR) repeat protein